MNKGSDVKAPGMCNQKVKAIMNVRSEYQSDNEKRSGNQSDREYAIKKLNDNEC